MYIVTFCKNNISQEDVYKTNFKTIQNNKKIQDLLENPSLWKVFSLVLSYGKFLFIAIALLYILFGCVFVLSLIKSQELLKISKNLKNTNETPFLEVFIKAFKIFFTEILIDAITLKQTKEENFKSKEINSKQEVYILVFFIASFCAVFINLGYTISLKILSGFIKRNLRKDLFIQLLDGLRDVDPFKGSKFFYGILDNIEILQDSLCQLVFHGILFVFNLIYLITSGNKEWKGWISLWILLLFIIIFCLYLIDKPSGIETKIKVIEGSNLINLEMQQFFNSFTNTILKYKKLLNKQFNNKIKRELLTFAIMIIGIILTCIILTKALFSITEDEGFILLLSILAAALQVFQFLPEKYVKFSLVKNYIVEGFLKLKKREKKKYISLRVSDVIKNIENQKSEKERNSTDKKLNWIDACNYMQKKNPSKDISYDKSNKKIIISAEKKVNSVNNIIFQNLKFQYPGVKLNHFNLEGGLNIKIEKAKNEGQIILLLGASGCGKSTLMKLILGYNFPTSGNLLLNNINTNEIDLVDFYRNSVLCFQFTKFIPTSIQETIGSVVDQKTRKDAQLKYNTFVEENKTLLFFLEFLYKNKYLFGKSLVDKIIEPYKFFLFVTNGDIYNHLIQKASEASGLQYFIDEMPNGYQTKIQSGGENLSGGMRQRVALSRMYLKIFYLNILNSQPSIMLLDEITASLDETSKIAIFNQIFQLIMDKKIIAFIITHDVSIAMMVAEKMKLKNNLKIMFIYKHGILYDYFSNLIKTSKDFKHFIKQVLKEEEEEN